MKQNHILTSLIVLMALSSVEVHGQAENAMPRLVVSILVDQLRTDYMEALMPLYGEDGIKQLLHKGRVYEQALYPTKPIDQAAAAAILASGSTAFDNGIIATQWWDRATQRPTNAVDDNTQQGINTAQGSSAHRLQVSTFSDELKAATQNKALVYAIAPSRETAIITAGHAANTALWIDDVTGLWASTSYYGDLPQWAKSISHKHTAANGVNHIWQPVDEVVGRFIYLGGGGTTSPFKHKFEGIHRYKDYKTSALVNEDVAEMVRHCLSYTTLGRDEVTDYLSVTLNANTYRHAAIEQATMELQDTYARLDLAVAKILQHIDKHIGINNALIVLTSTGSTPKTPSNLSQYRIPTGTVDIQRAGYLLNVYLMAIYGNGQYVEGIYGRDIYLNHKLLEQKNINRQEIYNKAQEFLLQFSGIKAVYGHHQIIQALSTQPVTPQRFTYNSLTSGDLILHLRAGWHIVNDAYGQEHYASEAIVSFPLIFYGKNISSERITLPAPIDAVAPTLSKALRIRAPNACSTPPLSGF